jgi:hypothetical protein
VEYDKAWNPVKSFCGLGFVPEERQDCAKACCRDADRWPDPDVTGGTSSEGEH